MQNSFMIVSNGGIWIRNVKSNPKRGNTFNHIEEGNGVSSFHINLAKDLCREKSASPTCIDLGNDKAAVLSNEKINTAVAALVRHVTMVSCILAHMEQRLDLFFSHRDRVPN